MVTTATKPILITIVGQTASGKSSMALELAEKYGGEIICADSRTVYKSTDIGTAKPTLADRSRVPHHLLDVVEPGQPFNAADFKYLANNAIADIYSKGKIPFLVGGTGLYVDSVLFDFEFGNEADPELRSELEALSDDMLRRRAEDLGITEDQVNFKNRRHLTRAIERGGVVQERRVLRENTLVLGIQLEAEELRERISQRLDIMIRDGLKEEVTRLLAKYGWDNEAMSGIGYKEWRPYLEGKDSLEHTFYLLNTHTVQYAKRQKTWFNRGDHIQWIKDVAQADRLIENFLLQYPHG